jgi:hypothetical protein
VLWCFAHFLKLGYFYLISLFIHLSLLSDMSSLLILGIESLLDVWFASSFSQSMGCLFVFAVQGLFQSDIVLLVYFASYSHISLVFHSTQGLTKINTCNSKRWPSLDFSPIGSALHTAHTFYRWSPKTLSMM